MNIQEKNICRLCFKICDNFQALKGDMKDVLEIVLKKVELAAIQEPVMCKNCEQILLKCFHFKATCFDTYDYIVPFLNKDDFKLDLMDVYLSKNGNGTGVSKALRVCGCCMRLVKNDCAIPFDVNEQCKDLQLENMIRQCLPELDFSVFRKPLICASCHASLKKCFRFVTNCLIAEKKMEEYLETHNIDRKSQIELGSVLEYLTRDVISERSKKHEVGIGSGGNDDEEHFTPKDILPREGVKIEREFCGVNGLKEENVEIMDQQPHEEIDIKTEKCDLNRFEYSNVLPQQEVNVAEATMYKCDVCLYQTKFKRYLKNHSLRHKDPSEVTMYKCDSCLFQTKYKKGLNRHLLKHKDPSEVTMYKCAFCLFQTKYKANLKTHVLEHTYVSEVMYKCEVCLYRTRFKEALDKHLLKHKGPSETIEIMIYRCDSCSFQTKRKTNFNRHLLKHKDPSEVTMYKCDSCLYQTKYKKGLKRHLVKHKDPSEVTMYKCASCLFQTKYKANLKLHVLKHMCASEVMYKREVCSYRTKFKEALDKHLLIHKDPLETT